MPFLPRLHMPPMIQRHTPLSQHDQDGIRLPGLLREVVQAEPLFPAVQERPVGELRQFSPLRLLETDGVVDPGRYDGAAFHDLGRNACGHGPGVYS